MPSPITSKRRKIAILGSTGSIGCSALRVAEDLAYRIDIVALAAHRRWERLAQQAIRFRAPVVAIADEAFREPLEHALNEAGHAARILSGPDALVELVRSVDIDFVLAAIVGAAGLASTLTAVERGLTIGLANKETLVEAGSIVAPLAERTGAEIIPVDSEHSAIFQAMHAGRHGEVERIYLTASGGPFRTWTTEEMSGATLEDALKHPTWSMGPKITIDSATMMNKALEIIEAKWLFRIPPDRIEVVIHPESIIHSMVQFHDGSVVAQLGTPDMRVPIQYAMTYPERAPSRTDRLEFASLRHIHFEPPDPQRFPALDLGYEVARAGGTAGAALNAGNEAAVEAFRAGRLRFSEIVPRAEGVLRRHTFLANPDLAQVLSVDHWARREVLSCCPV